MQTSWLHPISQAQLQSRAQIQFYIARYQREWISALQPSEARLIEFYRTGKGGKKVIKRYSIFHFAAVTVMTKIEIEAQVAVEEINFDEIKK